MLRAYPWSSYRSYIGKSKPLAFIDYGPILEMMDSDQRKRPATYRRFVEAGISDIDTAFIDTKKQSRLCIGSDSYNTHVDALYEDLIEGHACKQDVSFRRSGRCCSVGEVLYGICDDTRCRLDSTLWSWLFAHAITSSTAETEAGGNVQLLPRSRLTLGTKGSGTAAMTSCCCPPHQDRL